MLVLFALAALAVPTSAAATNPPVIYVHGVSENACAESQNLPTLRTAIRGAFPGTFDGNVASGQSGCSNAPPNPFSFLYVPDKSGGGDRDIQLGGSSQSGVGANADALREYVSRLWFRYHRKVMFVTYSMGGLVVRTYLERYPAEANDRVAAVAFVDSALSGAVLGRVAQGINSSKSCPTVDGSATPLCDLLRGLLRKGLHLENPDAIAFRDLAPDSAVVRDNAANSLPTSPRYLVVYGDLRLHVLGLGVGRWRFPATDAALGDIAIPTGDPSPHSVPEYGGARLGLSAPSYDSREEALPGSCTFDSNALGTLADSAIGGVGSVVNAGDCLAKSPVNHLNVDRNPDVARATSGESVTKLVLAFLLDSCRAKRLGDCGSAPSTLVPATGARNPSSSCGNIANVGENVDAVGLSCGKAVSVVRAYNARLDAQTCTNGSRCDVAGFRCLVGASSAQLFDGRCESGSKAVTWHVEP